MLPMDYTRLIVAVLFGFVLFSEIPSIYTALGGLLIFCSTVYIARREAQKSRDRTAAAITPE